MFSVNGLYDAWNMILITYNGLLGNLYLNGNVLSESFNYILETNGSMPLVIGSNSLNRDDEFFSGCIDDVRIYNRALSASEVASFVSIGKYSARFKCHGDRHGVNYNGEDSRHPPIVWALEANGTKVAEQILADGNGSYSLTVSPRERAYDYQGVYRRNRGWESTGL